MSRSKGLPKSGGRLKGSLNKTTLLKLERRAVFDELVSQQWKDIISRLKPEYIADQFMGKATDKIEVRAEVKTSNLTPEQIEAINKIALDE